MRLLSAPRSAQPAPDARRHRERSPLAALASVVLAAPVGGAAGIALGRWCRNSVGEHSVAGVLAEIGAPWIAAAFAAGALVAMLTLGRRGGRPLTAMFAGAIAGSSCLVAATIVYYGPARTGAWDVSGAGSATVVWTAIGIAVGVCAGAIGALWWTARSPSVAAGCLVVIGAALTSEAYYLLDVGGGGHDALVRNVLIAVAIVGVATPILGGMRWSSVLGVVAVALLALPGSIVAEVVSEGAIHSIHRLQLYRSL